VCVCMCRESMRAVASPYVSNKHTSHLFLSCEWGMNWLGAHGAVCFMRWQSGGSHRLGSCHHVIHRKWCCCSSMRLARGTELVRNTLLSFPVVFVIVCLLLQKVWSESPPPPPPLPSTLQKKSKHDRRFTDRACCWWGNLVACAEQKWCSWFSRQQLWWEDSGVTGHRRPHLHWAVNLHIVLGHMSQCGQSRGGGGRALRAPSVCLSVFNLIAPAGPVLPPPPHVMVGWGISVDLMTSVGFSAASGAESVARWEELISLWVHYEPLDVGHLAFCRAVDHLRCVMSLSLLCNRWRPIKMLISATTHFARKEGHYNAGGR